MQRLDIRRWIVQPIGMVDAQPIDDTAIHQVEQQLMGGVEDPGFLDANGDQRRNVEEAAVVELLDTDPPVGEPVVLRLHLRGRARSLVPAASGNSWL